jgi:hypothetical protein
MSRYNDSKRNGDLSIFAQVILGILTATLIITATGRVLIFLSEKAEEKKILVIWNELMKPTREAAIQRKKEIQAAIAIENAKAKERAEAEKDKNDFKKWYKKPERCEIMENHATRVFCANSYMRAWGKWIEIKKSQ